MICVLERSILSLDSIVFDKEKFPEILKVLQDSRAAVLLTIEAHRTGGDLIAARSAESAAFDYFADELIKILGNCK